MDGVGIFLVVECGGNTGNYDRITASTPEKTTYGYYLSLPPDSP
jgi:hypothetical protein